MPPMPAKKKTGKAAAKGQKHPKKQKRRLSYIEKSERVAKERRRRPVMRRIVAGVRILVILVCAGGVFWLEKTGQVEATQRRILVSFYDTTSKVGLNLENVYIEGAEHLDEQKVLDVVMPPERKTGAGSGASEVYPIFAVSIPELKTRLEELGWVEKADISRELPNALHIKIRERKPVAIWQQGQVLTLVDKSGVLISREDVSLFPKLPILVGEDAPAHLQPIYALLEKNPEIKARVEAMIRVGERRWNLRLQNGVEIRLPEQDIEKAWAALLALQQEKRVLDREVKWIDLRDKDRVYVQPSSVGSQ